MKTKTSSFTGVLRYRNFTIFSVAQMISQFGDRLNNMALLGLIGAKAAGSPFAFSQIAIFASLPVLIFGPVSGILADRLNRKWVLVAVDAARTLIVFLIPTLFYLTGNLLLVNLAVFLIFLLGLLFNSAKMSVLPHLVSNKGEYLTANAVANFIGRFATFLGLLLGGFVVDLYIWHEIGWDGWRAGFYIDASTYLISAAFLSAMSLPRLAVKPADKSRESGGSRGLNSMLKASWEDIKSAVSLIKRRTLIRLVYGAVALVVFYMGAAYSLDIMIAQQVFRFGTRGTGVLGGILGIGLILGSLFVGKWGKKWGEMKLMFWGLFLLAILMGLSAFTANFILFCLLTLAAGFLMSIVFVVQDTLFHRMVPPSHRGRIFAVKELLWAGGFMVSAVFLGAVGEFMKLFISNNAALQSSLGACAVPISAALIASLFWVRKKGAAKHF
ncbi:MAG: MFS transporter [candidate division WOR-3 bacterium]